MNRLTAKKYFSNFVTTENKTGDVWSNLPTNGLLNKQFTSGVVITPACDLAQNKADSITYLPIISIKEWLCSKSFYGEIKSKLLDNYNNAKIPEARILLTTNRMPSVSELNELRDLNVNIRDSITRDKINSGLNHLSTIILNDVNLFNIDNLSIFFGSSNFNSKINKIITNSHSTDIHFIPKDNQLEDYSATKEHSVILFRYPITAPIEIFNLSQEQGNNWNDEMQKLSETFKIAMSFSEVKPLKCSNINTDFMHDILSRYFCLYARIGSPDFTEDTILQITSEIIGA